MKRLFTFGCSFTSFQRWATWADILGLEYDHYENWGFSGSSNHFILYSIAECLQRNTLTELDTVVVMWTNVNRTCEFIDNKWIHNMDGSIFNKSTADEVNRYLITSASIIATVKGMLQSSKCNFHFLSMIKPTDKNHPFVDANNESTRAILNTYKSTFDSIQPSVYDIINNFDWTSRHTDSTPLRLYKPSYLNGLYDDLEKGYEEVKGPDWPPLTKALAKEFDGVSEFIQDEILINYGWVIDILSGDVIQKDSHSLPMEHFEYLAKLDIWDLTKKQLKQTEIWQQDIDSNSRAHLSLRGKVERFGQ